MDYNKKIYRILSHQYGLPIAPGTVDYLKNVMLEHEIPETELETAIINLVDAMFKENGEQVESITKEALESVVEKFLKQVQKQDKANVYKAADHFYLLNAFEMPKFDYHPNRGVFLPNNKKTRLLGDAEDKANFFRLRYEWIKQRTLRLEQFRPPAFITEEEMESKYLKMTPIKNLLGCDGEQFLLFGMLAQLVQGEWHLEDLDAGIRLDLSEAEYNIGIFTETCFVLCYGVYHEAGKYFKVTEMALPPCEPRHETISSHPMVNFFGGPNEIIDMVELKEIEEDPGNVFVILSDVWLDQTRVLEQLEKMFKGFQESSMIPVCFIFMGNFHSQPFALDGTMTGKYKEAFLEFLSILNKFPILMKLSQFVFVPGPTDPWGDHMLPRPSIPKFLTEKLLQKMPNNLYFTTNPCRIKFCTQEIIIFREDLLSKMNRNAIAKVNLDPEEGEKHLYKHMLNTLLTQMFLSPLPLKTMPVAWSLVHSLLIYPLPHLLILGDRQEIYETKMNGCVCINPGSFSVNQYHFMTYYPSTKSADLCQIEVENSNSK